MTPSTIRREPIHCSTKPTREPSSDTFTCPWRGGESKSRSGRKPKSCRACWPMEIAFGGKS